MSHLDRITFDPQVMGGQTLPARHAHHRGWGAIVGLVASGYPWPQILTSYPALEEEDIRQALSYAAWRVEETEVALTPA